MRAGETKIEIAKLRQQFHGAAFGELVLKQYKRLNYSATQNAIKGTADLLPDGARSSSFLEAWIDQVRPEGPQFWRRDCGQVLTEITAEARETLLKAGIRAEDEDLFNMFQIIVLSLAYSLHKTPSNVAFVRKALGHSFFQRLFG
jgi:hypothetical protein